MMKGINLLCFVSVLAALTDGRSIHKKSVPLMVPPVALRGSIPGVPGQDYPTLERVPKTGFKCNDRLAGYYADVETSCQVFHICQDDGRHDRFLCPNGTLFNQNFFICDWWYNVQCSASPDLYFLNKLFRPQLKGSVTTTGQSSVSDTPDRVTIPRTEATSVSPAGQELVPLEANRGQHQTPAAPASDQVVVQDSGSQAEESTEGAKTASEPSVTTIAVSSADDQGVSAFASASSSSSSSEPSSALASAVASLPSLFTVSSTVAPKINVVVPDIKATDVAEKLQSYGKKMAATPSKEWRLKSVNGVEYDSQLPVISTSVRISNSATRMPFVNRQSAVNAAQLAADSNGSPVDAQQTADQVVAQLDTDNSGQLADNLEAVAALEPVQSVSDDAGSQAEQSTEQAAEPTTATDVMDATSSDTSGQQNGADSSTSLDQESWQAGQATDNRLAQLTSSGAIDSSAADDGRQTATESISGQPVTLSLMADDLHDDGLHQTAEQVTEVPAESTTFLDATEVATTQQADGDIDPIVAVFFHIGEPQSTTQDSATETSVSQLDNVVN